MSHPLAFKAPQGLMRSLILAYASRYPVTGSEFADDVRLRTNGVWDPSPGSVYFLMNELRGKNLLIQMKGRENGRKAYIATEAGKAELSRTAKGLLASVQREVSLMALLASMVEPSSEPRLEALKWVLAADANELARFRERKA